MLRALWIRSLALTALIVAAAPCFAARAIQGATGEVSAPDGAALGQVGYRIWSALPGGETNFNDNVASCRNVRCLRNYITNSTLAPGGYVGNPEATQVYNGDLNLQPFYELVDASMNDGAGNHIGFYGVAGVTTDNSGVGSFLQAGCPPPGAQNCFGRIDADDAGPILNNTRASYGAGAGQIRPIGGLNPIPVPNVTISGGCPAGQVCLSWIDPPLYNGNMRPGTGGDPAPPSPVKGLRLYKIFTADCSDPVGNDPGWTPIGSFNLGQNSTQDPLPPDLGGCNWYAFTVRLVGPGGDPNEVETFRVGAHSAGVGNTVTAVRITRFSANYAGHGVVNVSWQTAVEGDIQGFYVTRSTSANGPFTRVSDLIRARGTDGATYATADHVSSAMRTYSYQLQVLGRDGSVQTSSTSAVTIPGRGKKGGPEIGGR